MPAGAMEFKAGSFPAGLAGSFPRRQPPRPRQAPAPRRHRRPSKPPQAEQAPACSAPRGRSGPGGEPRPGGGLRGGPSGSGARGRSRGRRCPGGDRAAPPRRDTASRGAGVCGGHRAPAAARPHLLGDPRLQLAPQLGPRQAVEVVELAQDEQRAALRVRLAGAGLELQLHVRHLSARPGPARPHGSAPAPAPRGGHHGATGAPRRPRRAPQAAIAPGRAGCGTRMRRRELAKSGWGCNRKDPPMLRSLTAPPQGQRPQLSPGRGACRWLRDCRCVRAVCAAPSLCWQLWAREGFCQALVLHRTASVGSSNPVIELSNPPLSHLLQS